MIGVEQIRTLEDRIEKALAFIAGLREENAALLTKVEAKDEARGRAEDRAAAAESRVRELEEAIATFKRDQSKIEEGILHALEKLDAFEDLVLRGTPQVASAAQKTLSQGEPVRKAETSFEVAQAPLDLPAETEEEISDRSATADDLMDSDSRQSVVPSPEQARTEPHRPEPARPVAPQSAPDELGIF
ncbi:MAG TPA: hypothetical protein VMV83_01480 [Rectinemataceae bacterium]|nr:hypothetical protein [Rectinemataceae bacterium]